MVPFGATIAHTRDHYFLWDLGSTAALGAFDYVNRIYQKSLRYRSDSQATFFNVFEKHG